jgi:hypothetical protein
MKFIKSDTSLRIQLSDTDRGKFTETPYQFISCISNDGVNIIIESSVDPNNQDLIYDYASVSEPLTANINILTEVLSCWVLEKARLSRDENGDRYIQHFPDVSSTGCWGVISHDACPNVLQAVGNTLYFDGFPLGGGGGGITTVDNGLNENPVGNARLGGLLIEPTSIVQNQHSFQITSPITTGGNTSFYSFPVLPDQGIIGISGTGGSLEVDGNSVNIRASVTTNINIITQDVANSTAINGQTLTLINSTTGQCEWQSPPPEYYRQTWNFNEQTIALAGWTQVLGLGGGTITFLPGEINHNGIFRIAAGGTGSGGAIATVVTAARLGGTTTTNKPFDLGDRTKIEMMVRFPSFQILTTYSINYRIGLIGDNIADFGVFFAMDTQNFAGQLAGRLYGVRVAGPAQVADTGIDIVAGQWYKLGIEINETLGIHNFYVNDVFVGQTTGNLTGAKATLSAGVWNRVTTTMTIPHQLDVDYFHVESPGQIIDTNYL